MKIIVWNCNGALRKKFESLLDFNADLIIVQECENPAESKDKKYVDWAINYLWIGDTKNKGLGVFAKQHIDLKPLDWSDIYNGHRVKHFLPCSINGKFDLLAVWTHQNYSPNFGYIGQFWKYLQINKHKVTNAIIAGDFNSNTIWDQWDRWWNHSDVVKELKEIGIESLYHTFTKEEQGKESQPTFYLHRNILKPYHIDYCFASMQFVDNLNNVTVEPFENWKHLSDHSPMIIIFEDR
ncbi:endonuclease/exonuclease/phosphatase family protein [Arcicella aquatica]|uniref:Endonuclease/exonuclease/phosphatase family protein n=1 Tax=Arcicella aquatica TaxID=217141 RepID=A0ABU5QTA3_9BACT|nr:endonuclease/exonuclease/phosphatase family protein [Arcicella aquatica]MEA5259944.1 endonuclease/exonuclease/phosphatase family protein [Arcicella aquatica]